jgi:putative flippase GtrA
LKIIGISGTLSIVYCVIGLYLLDKVGRIKPLIVSAAGMAAALLVNSVLSKYYVLTDNPNPNNDALRAMVAMNFVFSLFFTMIGIISWVYPAEVSSSCTHLTQYRFLLYTQLTQNTTDLPCRDSRTWKFSLHLHQLVAQFDICTMCPNSS